MNCKKVVGLALSAVFLALSFPVEAQQPGKIFRIGYLDSSTASGSAVLLEAFREELRKLGWIEGKNITIEYRFAEQKPERLPELAADLAAIALLPLTLPFAVANSRGSEARKARIADYMEKGFKDVKLNRGDSMHGFVYFWSHFKEDWPLKGNLILRFVNEIDGSDFIVRVPVIEQ